MSFTDAAVILFPFLGVQKEEELHVRLIDSLSKQVS